MGEPSVPGMLKENMKDLRLRKGNYLFPKPLVAMRTNTGRYLSYASAYKCLELLIEEFRVEEGPHMALP